MQVVPLSQVGGRELEPLLSEEMRCWRSQLFWDYRPAATLIRRYVTDGSLPGWVLRSDAGEISGYCYYLVQGPVGYIGNIYILSRWAALPLYGTLLNRILKVFEERAEVRRIEGQLFTFHCDLATLFQAHSFRVIRRHFLLGDIEQLTAGGRREPPPDGVRLLPWDPRYQGAAAAVIRDAYLNSVDFDLCHDYQSLEGCVRFLRNLIQNPGCGRFSPGASYLALDPRGEVRALLVSSRTESRTGMIPQISVKREYQGKGLGSLLLSTYFEQARNEGLKRVTLSVSEANRGAHRLYRRFGFSTLRDFYAFIRT